MAAKQATKGIMCDRRTEALKTASNHKRWIDTLEPEKRAELEEIRRRWHHADWPTSRSSSSMSGAAGSLGWVSADQKSAANG